MTQEHPHADILRAIADGKEFEWSNASNPTKYEAVSGDSAIFVLANYSKYPHFSMRVKPEVRIGWINIYPTYTSEIHATKEAAIERRTKDVCTACIKISYTPGEGLE